MILYILILFNHRKQSDDNRPYRYEQNIQEQKSLFTITENYNENDNNNEDYTLENQNENRNETIVYRINENNTSEYTTPDSTTSAQDASQTGTSTKNQLVRVPTRVVSPRPNTNNPQSYSVTSPRRNITLNFPSNSDDEIQDETQIITSLRNTSVNVSSPTRTILDTTQNINTRQNIFRSMYDRPSLPSTFKYPAKQIDLKTIIISKLPANIVTHSFTLFSHNLIQIFKRIIIKILLNLTVIIIC